MKTFNLEQSKILFNQFLDWHSSQGIDFFFNAQKEYSFLHEHNYFHDNIIKRLKNDDTVSNKLSTSEIQNRQGLYLKTKNKIIEATYNQLLAEIKNGRSVPKFDQLIEAIKQLGVEQKQQLWVAALGSNRHQHFAYNLFDLMKNNFSDATKNFIGLLINSDVQTNVFEKLKEHKDFKYKSPFIVLSLLSKSKSYLLEPYLNEEIAKETIEFFTSRGTAKNMHDFFPNYEKQVQELYSDKLNKIWNPKEKASLNLIDAILFMPNPVKLFNLFAPYLINKVELPEKLFQKIIFNNTLKVEDKISIFEKLKFEPSKLNNDDLILIKSKKDIELMSWLLENGINYKESLKPYDISKVPPEHRHKIKLKTILDYWKQKVSPEDWSSVEKGVLKAEFSNKTVKKVKML